jgi:hypothetical protein
MEDYSSGPIAAALAQQAVVQPEERGFVIGVTGGWGTGKTSLLNLTQEVLEDTYGAQVIRFDPWLFSGSDELVIRFLRELASQLGGWQGRFGGGSRQPIGYAQALAPLGAVAGAPWTVPILGLLARKLTGAREPGAV